MKWLAVAVYVLGLGFTFYSNKYVLSVLKFRFPLVFQGWQTMVGFLLLKALSLRSAITVTSMDKAGFISVAPSLFLFTVALVAGSKALSHLSVLAFVCSANLAPCIVYMLDRPKNSSVFQLAAVFVCAAAGLAVLAASASPGEEAVSLMDSAKFWMVLHAFSVTAVTLHGRISDARFDYTDRLFYGYIFGLVVLAPASLYVEEAFQAMHFHIDRQIDFVVACVFSAVAGVCSNLYAIRLKDDEKFVYLHHGGLAAVAVASAAIFDTQLSLFGWLAAIVHFAALMAVPKPLLVKEDPTMTNQSRNEPKSSPSMSETV